MSVHYSREQRAIADRDNKALVTVALPGFTFQGAVEKKDVESLNAFVMDWITARPFNRFVVYLERLVKFSISSRSCPNRKAKAVDRYVQMCLQANDEKAVA